MRIATRLLAIPTLYAALQLNACGGQEVTEGPKIPDEEKPPEEESDTSWETAAEEEAPKERATEEVPQEGSSRPALKLRHSSKIEASVDYTGAELILGDQASLVIPRDAVPKGVAYHFAQRQGNAGPKRIGLNYELAPALTSAADPFILELPLPSSVKTANFAMIELKIRDGKPGRGWKVVRSTRIDQQRGVAILETTQLPEGWVYLTSKSAD